MVYSSSGSGDDRRQHRRFLVNGIASLQSGSTILQAELLNVGAGGLLVLTEAALPDGVAVQARFLINNYPLEVVVNGFVAHSTESTMGIAFSEEPDGLDEIILWLEAGFMAGMLT